MNKGSIRALLGWLCTVLLCACSGGSQTSAGIDRGGWKTPVAIQGPITAFGSIVVHGVHYDISQASITVDDEHASGTDLALGQIVTVLGERDDTTHVGVADTVEFQANVRGPVAALDAATGALTVLGQRIETDAGTVFDLGSAAATFASLQVGQAVEVSGFVGSSGAIVATRVAAAASATFRVYGSVAHVDAAAATFMINDLVVDYSAAGVLEGFSSGQPSDGDTVVVIGSTLGQNGELVASLVRRATGRLESAEGHEGEVEGLITRFASAADFDVAGTPVATDSSTTYAGGTAADLGLDVKVEVHGEVDAQGAIVATEIEIDTDGRFDDDKHDD